MIDEDQDWLSPADLAKVFNVSVATVYAWRKKNYGPRGYRVGRHVRYPPAEVNRWLRSQTNGFSNGSSNGHESMEAADGDPGDGELEDASG